MLDITSILTQTHTERLKRWFCRYRAIVKDKHTKNLEAKRILLKIQNANTRWAFTMWAKQTDKIIATQELNETGPITEQVFEANRCIRNLKNFMRDESFTEEQITAKVNAVAVKSNYLMTHLVARLKVPKENRVMSRCWDQWVMWIKVKRLMKHHLNFANAQV